MTIPSVNKTRSPKRVLVLSLQPFRFATRPRKAAQTLAGKCDVLFLSPSAIGRAGQWDVPGHRVEHGVKVLQLPADTPKTAPNSFTALYNIAKVYGVVGVRLARQVLNTPADAVFSTSLALAPFAMLHRRKFNSRIVVDVSEHPSEATVRGSLASWFARSDSAILHRLQRTHTVLTTVTYGIADKLKDDYGFNDVRLVRNVPAASWRAAYLPPPGEKTLSLVNIGSIFETRGFELLIETMAECKRRGIPVRLTLYGNGRAEYLQSLHELVGEHDVADRVTFAGSLARDEVSATYLKHDAGLVIYEPTGTANDGLSNKLMECVSTGRPVIAGNLPENTRFVTHYGVGELAEMSVEGLTDAIETFQSNTDRDSLARHCRNIGDDELTWEKEFASVASYLLDRQ